MLPHLPAGMPHQVFDFGLHVNPGKLRQSLQDAIDAASPHYDTIILGYGLCSMAVIGLHATACRLVVPKVHDCISIFLGSRQSYEQQAQGEPGTYYLTKGWIEVGDTPFSDYQRALQRYGKEKADYFIKAMLGNYTRLAFINTGLADLERYQDYASRIAEQFGLRYEEIKGSDSLVKKMLLGPWDEDFVVLEPGQTFQLDHFFKVD
jgi:hypothetical protein